MIGRVWVRAYVVDGGGGRYDIMIILDLRGGIRLL
jgi:hypothetical protein